MVDHTCKISGAESVINIDDTDTAGTGIEHGKEGRESAEGGPISDTGRNCYNRRMSAPTLARAPSIQVMAMITRAVRISSDGQPWIPATPTS